MLYAVQQSDRQTRHEVFSVLLPAQCIGIDFNGKTVSAGDVTGCEDLRYSADNIDPDCKLTILVEKVMEALNLSAYGIGR